MIFFYYRFFMGINPSTGSKSGLKKREGQVSGKVFALVNAMALFESDWTNEQYIKAMSKLADIAAATAGWMRHQAMKYRTSLATP